MSTNRLQEAGSAYLRSAAHQPVHWFPWGPEAFAQAASLGRPVLLDVGAVWCHWCHVMDQESYEDPGLAAFLNDRFVCVKVDRDERPDVDARYQRAVQAVARQGGWPLTGFLTPGAELFFGGTYFPPRSAPGRPSFREVLERVLEVWRDEPDRVMAQATSLQELLSTQLDESAPGEVSALALHDATHRMLTLADRAHGGFGTAPKFPHPAALTFLLHRWCETPEPTIRAVIHETLDGMARGGFRDLLGGGFHRYSVDERWIIPHFEKMSSDNAELLRVYAEAAATFENPAWREAAGESVRWIREVLADPAGGFGASQDADAGPGDDGDYFTWTREEVAAVLPAADLDLAVSHLGIGTWGRMPHAPERNVLFRAAGPDALAERFGLPRSEIVERLAAIGAALRAARGARPAPFVDGTRYANWNAMLAGALLRAGPVIGDPWCREAALTALRRIREEQSGPDGVSHAPGGQGGLLDDPVQCAAAALDALETTGERSWLDWAAGLMEQVWRDHWDEVRGGLFDVARGRKGEGLLGAPVKPIQDSPNASPNGVAGLVLARLFEHTRQPPWRERHQALVVAFAGSANQLGLFASAHLLATDWLVHPATHLVITGPADDPVARQLHDRALAAFVPRRVVVRLLPESDLHGLPPALAALTPAAPVVRAIACAGDRCLIPVDRPEEWAGVLRSLVPNRGS
ncbi:MAG TPA: thioredoxin domain-containing protein [Gemmatimonadales bacterium]|nr:thioredoxin domain-containing protein [Gemmatimonadales bacterium]